MRQARLALLAAAALALVGTAPAVLAAGQEIRVEKRTAPGKEVRIRGFAPYNAQCQPLGLPTIQVSEPPAQGEVSQRPETVTVGEAWVGDSRCAGTRLDGVSVYYTPRPGFTGQDRFMLQIDYPGRLGRARASVEVTVAP